MNNKNETIPVYLRQTTQRVQQTMREMGIPGIIGIGQDDKGKYILGILDGNGKEMTKTVVSAIEMEATLTGMTLALLLVQHKNS